MVSVLSPTEQKIILIGVSWETYERLLDDLSDSGSPRLTYDRGTLEIMSPSAEHEEINRTIALLVEVLAEELGVDIRNLGSTTFRREDIERGFEPDSCFYIEHLDEIEGKTQLDLAVDPPPDLVVEIDVTSPSIDKLPIYAQAGVPEIWRYDGDGELVIYILLAGEYQESDESMAFPLMTGATLIGFISESRSMRRTAWLRKLRDWIRA
jgi:Uma2 family endonuclease